MLHIHRFVFFALFIFIIKLLTTDTDKSIASAIKFTAQFVKPPVLADAQPEEPPNHFSNATLLFNYLFSLSPALLPEGGTFTSAQIVEFYKDAQNLLIPIIKRLKERQVHMDFNRLMAVSIQKRKEGKVGERRVRTKFDSKRYTCGHPTYSTER